ncbi:hypothetical protein PALB_30280 [Pseudoalteromonas luteoviolacea B = ATCC 29581]|nr:hypothetical protein PALB_30280 [Pseudoalteromonas luteoviolacea B = ATCC 29581]
MNKAAIIEQIRFALENTILEAKEAAYQAREGAVHEQSIAETQYDSLAIEAGYLAHGHSQRADNTINSLRLFDEVASRKFTKVEPGSLVQLLDSDDMAYWYCIVPNSGGQKIQYGGHIVWTISLDSPLGKKIGGLVVDEEIRHTINNKEDVFLINQIL